MQINDRNGVVTIKLLQAEARRIRDAAYLTRMASVNLPQDDPLRVRLSLASVALLEFANRCTPEASKEKLDRQDAETPPSGDAIPESRSKNASAEVELSNLGQRKLT